jgi:KDO2-lipid IV(A) lauroyltransferase
MAYRTKHILEYGFLRGATALMQVLPLRGALAFGWILAALMYPFVSKRAAEAQRRMRSVLGPGPSACDLRRWAWISWRNIFFNVVEIARAPRWTRADVDRLVDHAAVAALLERQRTHGGYTMAVCHMGNWELAGFTVRLLGLPLFVMMRGQSNPLVTAYLNRIREAAGVGAIERHSKALGQIAKRIRAGEVFTILPDIRAKSPDGAVRVPFLGGEAYLNAGTCLFARHTETPVVTAYVRRVGWTRHQIVVHDPIFPDPSLDKHDDIARMLGIIMARFDAEIRRDPGQYFWYNKRWVLDPDFAPTPPRATPVAEG